MGFQRDIPPIMAMMDIILVPAENEPFARVILEAMALGKPIIGTTSGGTPEMLEHHKSGLLVPARDPAALAKAIIMLAFDSALRVQLGANARSRVQEMFTITAHVKQVEKVYDLCLADEKSDYRRV
jgi:glycosyltransferase involved in cell wall biosynthesis